MGTEIIHTKQKQIERHKMLNLTSTGKVTLALIIIILLLSGAFVSTIAICKSKIKSLETTIKEEQLQGLFLQDSLTSANLAIDKQNKLIKDMEIKQEQALTKYKARLQDIQKQKASMVNYALKDLQDNKSCEDMLHIISKNQKEFIYGRTSNYNKNQ